MKKLTISFLAVIFSLGTVFSQPISDMGIVPVGVTLNSILRLNITGGGNLEYSINTMAHYTGGIIAQAPYITTFTVASSVNFSVDLYADNADFTGVSTGAAMDIRNLGYTIAVPVGAGTDGTNWALIGGLQAVLGTAARIINGAGLLSAGNITQNNFIVNWELSTPAVVGITAGLDNLLLQNLTSDRYVANVVLELIPTP